MKPEIEAPPTKQSTVALDIITAIALLIAAYMLNAAAYGYHRYSYYTEMRFVTVVASALAAYRLYFHRAMPLAIVAALMGLWFNPFLPVRIQRYEWVTYDHLGSLLSIALALVMGWLAYRQYRTTKTST